MKVSSADKSRNPLIETEQPPLGCAFVQECNAATFIAQFARVATSVEQQVVCIWTQPDAVPADVDCLLTPVVMGTARLVLR